MIDETIPATPRTTLRHVASRGTYDRATIYQILDEALVGHVGFVSKGQPYVMPTNYVRIEDQLYIHGSRKSRMIRCLRSGTSVCLTATLVDGLVLARSVMHHSMNYRSVVVLGTMSRIDEPELKREVLRVLTEHVIPGRWDDARPPTDKEIDATAILSLPITEASAKVRTGPPQDAEADYALPHWAGVLPLTLTPGQPVNDPRLAVGIDVPPYVAAYRRKPEA